MQTLRSATSQCPAEFSAPASPEHVPCFVSTQLRAHELSVRYAAHGGNATGINGDSLIFSLMKRLAQDSGDAFYPPQLRLQLEPFTGDAPDTNCQLLLEALTTFDLPVTQALACTHLHNPALALGYHLVCMSLGAQGKGHVSYAPTITGHDMRKAFGV